MILWTIKLFNTLRRAIAGRRYPHQLAWAVAFGLLLGIIPHGNLLAILLLVVVLSLKLNHAAAALTAIGVSFIAARLDPISHEVGNYVLTHPDVTEVAQNAWALPLVPWMDLNNTVVMGSFVIGTAALLPVFMITYPLFRAFRPKEESAEAETATSPIPAKTYQTETRPITLVDHGHGVVPSPHRESQRDGQRDKSGTTNTRIDFKEIASHEAAGRDVTAADENKVAVQTRVDVIRMSDASSVPAPHDDYASTQSQTASSSAFDESQPMDEALNYLLRQLRDSQTRKSV
ncbi:MAG: TIGR03546 family protein [Rubripirellula sp.]